MSRLVASVSLMAVVLLVMGLSYRPTVARNADLLPVSFIHGDHVSVSCLDCHHEFVDDSGLGSCYGCHKLDPTVNLEIRADFHDFCWDCHVDKALAGEAGGPVRVCSQCHSLVN